jgi:Histone acetylation protein/TAZ zinc finger/Zinc finger, ZZ type
MIQRYSDKGYPTEFPLRSKCIALFQKIHGVDTLLFAMYVYEYGDDCPVPNRRRVYISYLDSVRYFEPKCYRTSAYHAVMVEYLRYVKKRGFHSAYIWSCPPVGGDDYIFYCHPKHQLVPREDMLRSWYHKMLDQAKAQGIVLRTSTLYDDYFTCEGVNTVPGEVRDATCLPYFEGDYIPGEIEIIIQQLEGNGGSASETSSQDSVMVRLGHHLQKMKDNFIVVHLRSMRFLEAVQRGDDVSNWKEDSDDDMLRSKRAKISAKSTTESDSQNIFSAVQAAASNMPLQSHPPDTHSSLINSTDIGATTMLEERDAAVIQHVEKLVDDVKGVECLDRTSGLSSVEHHVLPSVQDASHKSEQSNVESQMVSQGESSEIVEKEGILDTIKLAISDKKSKEAVDELMSHKQENADFTSTSVIKRIGLDESQIAVNANSIGKVESESYPASDDTPKVAPDNVLSHKDLEYHMIPESKREQYDHDASDDIALQGRTLLEKSSNKRILDEIKPAVEMHFSGRVSSTLIVGDTTDEDPPLESEMFESRQQFLNYCQTTHCQFDELRRAKHSTVMVLFQLHNPTAPKFLQQCGACYRDITHGIRYHCNQCSNFDLCEDCYEPVVTGMWAKRDPRFAHDEKHIFTPIDLESTEESQNSQDRQRSLKAHVQLLEHAGACVGPPSCSLHNCDRLKKLFLHVPSCDVKPKRDCKICTRLLVLCTMHSRLCDSRGACPIPFCDRIRERNKRLRRQQQLMDDRRRQAQNELYRAGG